MAAGIQVVGQGVGALLVLLSTIAVVTGRRQNVQRQGQHLIIPVDLGLWQGKMPEQRAKLGDGRVTDGQENAFNTRTEIFQQAIGKFTGGGQQDDGAGQ